MNWPFPQKDTRIFECDGQTDVPFFGGGVAYMYASCFHVRIFLSTATCSCACPPAACLTLTVYSS